MAYTTAGAMSAKRCEFSTASTCSRSAALSARGCALSRGPDGSVTAVLVNVSDCADNRFEWAR
ncbi:Uncharacterised protein [Mycobacterium tuberculosis]|nr:Uncharacterised protein [Mycobacterium tuberculosis]